MRFRDNPHQLAQCLNEAALDRAVAGAVWSSTAMQTALDNTALTFATGGHADWYTQTGTTHDGSDAARSGAIGHEEFSWITTHVTGPGCLSFWWRTRCHDSDGLVVLMDANAFEGLWSIHGNSGGWVKGSVPVPVGEHVVRWIYWKNESGVTSPDSGYLDEVVYASATADAALADAVENTELALFTDSLYPWTRQTAVSHAGGDAAAGPPLANPMDKSWMGAAITGPCRLTFRGRTADTDAAIFWAFLDQQPIAEIDRVGGWDLYACEIGPGLHTLLWLCIKIDSGTAVGYVDSVTVTPRSGVAAPIANQALDVPGLVFRAGGDGGWQSQSFGAVVGSSAMRSGPTGDGQGSWLMADVKGGPGTLSFWWQVSSEDECDFLRFTIDDEEMARMTGDAVTTDWNRRSFDLGPGDHRVGWTYMKDDADYEGQDRGWLDGLAWTGDSDGDGMTDDWELERGLCPTNTAGREGADGDPDGDGACNYAEFVADTDPTNSACRLCIRDLRVDADGVRLQWTGGRLAWQFLERCADLGATPQWWETLWTNMPPTAASVERTQTGVGPPAGVYRVRAARAP